MLQTTHGKKFAAMSAMLLALAGVANADSISSGHKGKSGNLRIATPTDVAGTILPAGDYEVKAVNSPDGIVMEFTRTVENELASELVSPFEEQVVARVKVTEEPLNSKPKHTQLFLAHDGKNATSLEIRGDNTDYVFAAPQLASHSYSVRADDGMH